MSNSYTRARNRLIYETLMSPSFYKENKNFVLKEYEPGERAFLAGQAISSEIDKAVDNILKTSTTVQEVFKQISQVLEASKEDFSWQEFKSLLDSKEILKKLIAATLVLDAVSLVDPSGIADMVSGLINCAYSASNSDYSFLGFWMPLLQFLLGASQFLSGGTSTPIVMLIKRILKSGRIDEAARLFFQNFSVIKNFILSAQDSILRLISKNKFGKFIAEQIKTAFRYISQKTENFFRAEKTSQTLVSPSEAKSLEKAIDEAASIIGKGTTEAIVISRQAINNFKSLLKTVGFAGLQTLGFKLNLGISKLAAFEEQTNKIKLEAERYMRTGWCKESVYNENLCNNIYTDPKTLEAVYTERPNKLVSPTSPSETEDVQKQKEFEYETKREQILEKVVEKYPEYLKFYEKMK